MRLDDAARDEQAEARSAVRTARYPEELLEQTRLVSFRNTRASIGDLEAHVGGCQDAVGAAAAVRVLRAGPHDDLGILRRKADRVREEVREHELEPIGIDVTIICPGWIRTPLTTSIDVPQPYMMEVERAVERILRAVRDRSAFVAFPASAALQVRLLRWLPSRFSDWLVRRKLARLMRQERPRDRRAEPREGPGNAAQYVSS